MVVAEFEFVAVWHGNIDVRHDESFSFRVAVDHATVGFYVKLIHNLIHGQPQSSSMSACSSRCSRRRRGLMWKSRFGAVPFPHIQQSWEWDTRQSASLRMIGIRPPCSSRRVRASGKLRFRLLLTSAPVYPVLRIAGAYPGNVIRRCVARTYCWGFISFIPLYLKRIKRDKACSCPPNLNARCLTNVANALWLFAWG